MCFDERMCELECVSKERLANISTGHLVRENTRRLVCCSQMWSHPHTPENETYLSREKNRITQIIERLKWHRYQPTFSIYLYFFLYLCSRCAMIFLCALVFCCRSLLRRCRCCCDYNICKLRCTVFNGCKTITFNNLSTLFASPSRIAGKEKIENPNHRHTCPGANRGSTLKSS